MRPCSVMTALIFPLSISRSKTLVSSNILAPAIRAPLAKAWVISEGLAWPSVGMKAAPITSSIFINGHRSSASVGVSRSIFNPNEWAVVA